MNSRRLIRLIRNLIYYELYFLLIPVAIDLIVQHIRDFLSDRLSLESLTLSPTTTPALSNVHNGRGGKSISFSSDPNIRPH